jgi:hypothetical protein
MSLTRADIDYFAKALESTSTAKIRELRQLLEAAIATRMKRVLASLVVDYELKPVEIAYIQRILLDNQLVLISNDQSTARRAYERIRKKTMAMVREDVCHLVADRLSQAFARGPNA